MSLDVETYVSNREEVIRGHEADEARRRADYEAEKLVESVEAREAYWAGVMREMPQHVRDIRYEQDAG